jgi:hypothetical protein
MPLNTASAFLHISTLHYEQDYYYLRPHYYYVLLKLKGVSLTQCGSVGF